MLQGRDRKENARWLSFRTWYGFDAFYCEPGIGGAHEKGGVEGEIGRFRRNFLVPVPRVKSLADLNARLAEDDLRDGQRHVEFRRNTVAADFAKEAPLLRPLPPTGSTPARYCGRRPTSSPGSASASAATRCRPG